MSIAAAGRRPGEWPWLAGVAAVLLGLPFPVASAQHSTSSPGPYEPRIARILVDSTAVRPVLRRLWEESVSTGREQVACIGGERRGREFRIGRATDLREAALDSGGPDGELESDSVSVSREWSRLSVETCGPPDWVGTVHTHRVERGVEYPGLSSDDRAVVSLWHARWRSPSVFCVMYAAEKPPYCEYQS